MKSVKDYSLDIYEKSIVSSNTINSKTKYMNSEWKNILIDPKQKIFLQFISNVRPKMKLYKYGSIYYLSSIYNEYIAHIDVDEKTVVYNNKKYKALTITDGNSKHRGKYIVLLLSILEYVDIDFIFSDKMLSNNAIKFYKKILSGGPFNSYVLLDDKVYIPNDTIDYFKNNTYRIGLSSLKGHINEIINEFDSLNSSRRSDNGYNDIALLYSINEEL